MKHLFNFFIVCLFLLPAVAQAQISTSIQSFEDIIDEAILAQKEAMEVPGLALGLILDGEVVYAKAHGFQKLEPKEVLTTQSLFHMASVSKPFVATAIMQLVEAGKLKLDETLITYLPYFKMGDEAYSQITIRQVLTHSSGIPDVEDYEWKTPEYDDQAAERYVKSFTNTKLDFEPGKKFSYSNAGFDILADVIAKTSGMSFEEYMKKNIFEPLGMKNSTFYKPEVPEKLATQPHWLNQNLKMAVGDFYPYNRKHAPSSTLHSNIEDMLLWAQINLNQGKFQGKRIYNKKSYEILTTSQRKAWGNNEICLSWFSGKIGKYQIFKHSGGDEGYRTFFAFVPERNTALVLMANHDFFPSSLASERILANLLLGQEIQALEIPIHLKLKDYILTEGIEKCKRVYFEEKKNHPKKYIFRGWCLDDLGYELLKRAHLQEALDVFKFNVELYPKQGGFYDRVADAYKAMEKKEKAIEWYQKALEIDPKLDISRKKLEAIKNQ